MRKSMARCLRSLWRFFTRSLRFWLLFLGKLWCPICNSCWTLISIQKFHQVYCKHFVISILKKLIIIKNGYTNLVDLDRELYDWWVNLKTKTICLDHLSLVQHVSSSYCKIFSNWRVKKAPTQNFYSIMYLSKGSLQFTLKFM